MKQASKESIQQFYFWIKERLWAFVCITILIFIMVSPNISDQYLRGVVGLLAILIILYCIIYATKEISYLKKQLSNYSKSRIVDPQVLIEIMEKNVEIEMENLKIAKVVIDELTILKTNGCNCKITKTKQEKDCFCAACQDINCQDCPKP